MQVQKYEEDVNLELALISGLTAKSETLIVAVNVTLLR